MPYPCYGRAYGSWSSIQLHRGPFPPYSPERILCFSNHLIPFHPRSPVQDPCSNYISQPNCCIKWSVQTILTSFLFIYLLLFILVPFHCSNNSLFSISLPQIHLNIFILLHTIKGGIISSP